MDDLFVTSNGASYLILCGVCRQPAGFIGEFNGETDQAGCDYCDNFADVKETADIALKYAEDAAQLKPRRAAIDAGTEHLEPVRFTWKQPYRKTRSSACERQRFSTRCKPGTL